VLLCPTNAPTRQNEATDPVTAYHDVLVLNLKRQLYHVPVNKRTGEFADPPENFTQNSEAHRKVFKIAGEPLDPQNEESVSKVCFGILPIRQEPNSSFVSCYLVNSMRLNPVNHWTQADWSDHPERPRVRRECCSRQRAEGYWTFS
jgi:hypothetical protein